MIAGHTFALTPHGRVCTCGRLWTQIAGARAEDVGQIGIAHVGALTADELGQIEAERSRVWEAVVDVARAASA